MKRILTATVAILALTAGAAYAAGPEAVAGVVETVMAWCGCCPC